MKTATLDQTKIIEALDWEPACEARNGCDRAADLVLVYVCGCSQLMCRQHRDEGCRDFNAGVYRHLLGHCTECGYVFGHITHWGQAVAREVPL